PVNSPVLDDQGRLRYIIHRVEDVTEFILLKEQRLEQSRLTDSLREQAEKMEADIYARSKAVAESNQHLHQANAELARLYEKTRELDELKTQFFANISHELRTPLTLILGPTAKHLEDARLDPGLRRDLEMVERNARMLYRHVSDLLDVAKLEAGRMVMRYAQADLARLTRIIASHFDALAEGRRIRYTASTPPAMPAQVDVEKYQRILLNLLSNAFKFVADGGTIQVRLAAVDGRALIQVQDDGPGIPEEMRDKVFEPFRQVEGSTGRHHGGTGLGLAIVRELVLLHSGSITLGTAPGGGALFTLALPLQAPPGTTLKTDGGTLDEEIRRQTLAELERPQVQGAAPEAALVDTDAPLVLVVEDNPDMSTFIAEALGRQYRVVTARDGQEGLEKAQVVLPDLIISDMMMPRLSGDRMVQALRRKPGLGDVPIVVLTAKADNELRIRLLQDGVQDFLNKPFSMQELLARVHGLLTERRQAANLLRQSEARFRATFSQAAVGMAHVGPDGRWLLVNQRLCDITGYTREELVSRTFQEITHAEDLQNDLALMHRLLAGEVDSYAMEKRYLHRDGHPIWINLTVSLVRGRNGSPEYFIAVIEDIQRRKAAEEQVRLLNADLERRVEQRTAELQVANRELDSFAHAVSHDLRAPLRAMTGFSRAILEDHGDALAPEARDYLDHIIASGRHMGTLIEGLLTLSRSTQEQLRRDNIDLSALAQRILRELARDEP
ncbi:MAG TPA: PAS domain S-box protein, partial [Azospira sp.]|nr:PAS domain S-box protein [Azospira sp.]